MHRDDLHFRAVEQPSRLSLQFEPPFVRHRAIANNSDIPVATRVFATLGARPEQVREDDLGRGLALRCEEVAQRFKLWVVPIHPVSVAERQR